MECIERFKTILFYFKRLISTLPYLGHGRTREELFRVTQRVGLQSAHWKAGHLSAEIEIRTDLKEAEEVYTTQSKIKFAISFYIPPVLTSLFECFIGGVILADLILTHILAMRYPLSHWK